MTWAGRRADCSPIPPAQRRLPGRQLQQQEYLSNKKYLHDVLAAFNQRQGLLPKQASAECLTALAPLLCSTIYATAEWGA